MGVPEGRRSSTVTGLPITHRTGSGCAHLGSVSTPCSNTAVSAALIGSPAINCRVRLATGQFWCIVLPGGSGCSVLGPR